MAFGFLEKKFGKDAGEKVGTDSKAPEALKDAFNKMTEGMSAAEKRNFLAMMRQ